MNTRRRWWIAGLLSLTVPGLGHLYCGRALAGIALYAFFIVATNVCFLFFGLVTMFPWNFIIPLAAGLGLEPIIAINSAMIANRSRTYTIKKYNLWYLYLLVSIAHPFVLSTLVFTADNYATYSNPSQSMENTLMAGDYVLADKTYYVNRAPKAGDIIIFLFPLDQTTPYLKRCVAIPGDTVEIRDKTLYINGERFEDEDYARYLNPSIEPRGPGGKDSRDNWGPFVVPAQSYFFLGDNRDNSYDSRYWKAVHRDLILGRAEQIYYSEDFSRLGILLH